MGTSWQGMHARYAQTWCGSSRAAGISLTHLVCMVSANSHFTRELIKHWRPVRPSRDSRFYGKASLRSETAVRPVFANLVAEDEKGGAASVFDKAGACS